MFICGLTGTIVETVSRLIHRGFMPCDKKVRATLGVPAAIADSIFFEDYDLAKPAIDIDDPQIRDRLRTHVAGKSS